MAQVVNPPRGMRDFLPAEKRQREQLLAKIRSSYLQHGFDEIETPVVEELSRLHSGLGGDNEKLSYSILKRGISAEELAKAAESGNALDLADIGLRFDLTVPLARFYASHRAELPQVFRSIQIAPVWRAERPQKGRYRQFVQCDLDIIGESGIVAEVELISATLATLKNLGLHEATIRINDRRILSAMLEHFGFAADEHSKVLITIDKLDKLGPDEVINELNELGFTKEAVEALKSFLLRPQTLEFNPFGERQIRKALPEGIAEEAVQSLLSLGTALAGLAKESFAGIPLVFDPFLVRGMGYYTGTIFEIQYPGINYSLGGGGRYDGMIGRFLGQEVPAVGFSIGFERIVDLIAELEATDSKQLALVYSDQVSLATVFELQRQLIANGSRVRLLAKPKKLAPALDSLKAQGFSQFALLESDSQSLEDLELRELS